MVVVELQANAAIARRAITKFVDILILQAQRIVGGVRKTAVNEGYEGEAYNRAVHNEFTSITERDGDWFIAYCPEIPGANGQGRTADEARASLAAAISLILDDRRNDALRGVPEGADRGTVVVE